MTFGDPETPVLFPSPPKQRVVTVRMSEAQHASLRAEAADNQISLNQLCLLKLGQTIDARLVPRERWHLLAAREAARKSGNSL